MYLPDRQKPIRAPPCSTRHSSSSRNAFTPDLAKLDAMIMSLEVKGSITSLQPTLPPQTAISTQASNIRPAPVITDTDLLSSGPGEQHYPITAKAGQAVVVNVTSNGPLSPAITSPGGSQRFPEISRVGDEYRTSHTFVTSEEGEYRLTLFHTC